MSNIVIDFNNQLSELKKYIIFDKEKLVKKFLIDNGYYRTSRYAKFSLKYASLLKSKPSSDFLLSLYRLDEDLRIVLFKYIRYIEITFRSTLSEILVANTNDCVFYLDANNYTPSKSERDKKTRNLNVKQFGSFFTDLQKKEEDLRRNAIKYPELKDYRSKGQFYGEKIASWALFEYLDFGTIVLIYEYLTGDMRKSILNSRYNYDNISKSTTKEVDTWLNAIRNLRNKCAHHNRIIGTTSSVVLKHSIDTDVTLESDSDLFSRIYAIIKFLPKEEVRQLKAQLQKIIKKFEKDAYSVSDLDILPKDWEEKINKIIKLKY